MQRAQANLPAILSALENGPIDEVEVLVCYAQDDPIDCDFSRKPYLKLIEGRADALIPELWRDGILAAKGERVAILTAHCVPNNDWLSSVCTLDLDSHVAYGGVIENCSTSDAVGRAIYLLRYGAVAPPQTARDVEEVAADNAVYRRSDILACKDLLPLGFWEPSYHERFRIRGLKLALRPDLIATHFNTYKTSDFMRQRRRHGRAFGLARCENASLPLRIAMFATCPLSFFIFGTKLMKNMFRQNALHRNNLHALPLLFVFLASWSFGECCGYADALFRSRRRAETSISDDPSI